MNHRVLPLIHKGNLWPTILRRRNLELARVFSLRGFSEAAVGELNIGSSNAGIIQNTHPDGSNEIMYNMLPPLPEPQYSVYKRVLPSALVALSSPRGRKLLVEALIKNSASSYFPLSEQFVSQSDPAFCGITTLLMVLNSFNVDPGIRWRGGWRFYGNEDVLLDRCCISAERVRRVGIDMEEFRLLGKCHGLNIQMKRASAGDDEGRISLLNDFRDDLERTLTGDESSEVVVVSFSRAHLSQTGDGHFSPIAAYHRSSDQVLILDVARFKYPPYWVSVDSLFDAMSPKDKATNQSRGWFLVSRQSSRATELYSEAMRPAELVPKVGDGDICPVGKLKVSFCKANLAQHL